MSVDVQKARERAAHAQWDVRVRGLVNGVLILNLSSDVLALADALEQPMYGPEGRWKELRERAEAAEARADRLAEALRFAHGVIRAALFPGQGGE